jgi:hypothetical protein
MVILVRLIGIFAVGAGIIFLVSPKTMRQFMLFWKKGKRLYIGGMLRILIGVIFLLAASECRLVEVMVTLGILFIITGSIIFVIKLNRLKIILTWWYGRSLLVIRLIALISIAVWLLILYSI